MNHHKLFAFSLGVSLNLEGNILGLITETARFIVSFLMLRLLFWRSQSQNWNPGLANLCVDHIPHLNLKTFPLNK